MSPARGRPGRAGRGDDDADGPAQRGVFGVEQGDVDDDPLVPGTFGGGAGVAGQVEADGAVPGAESGKSFVPAAGAGEDADDSFAVAFAGAHEPAARPGCGDLVQLGEDVLGDFGAEVEREVGQADRAGALLEPVDADDVAVPVRDPAPGGGVAVVGQQVDQALGVGAESGDADGFGDPLGGLITVMSSSPTAGRPRRPPLAVRSGAGRAPLPTGNTTILAIHHFRY